ncbi:putative esterase [Pseudocercospora fuligena]|uniref:Carboxylic ester hydrolase n=1 Tax=Pseudocercospora fuligena TaxID=685502 RepID=A0A8H6VK60_9PEZI|nr:putative esterase [Pseudocercospora fuligena]
MSLVLILLSILSLTYSHTIPYNSTCLDPDYVDLAPFNATLIQSAYYVPHAKNVSGTFNKYSFCEINGTVSYGDNDTLAFTVWLPDNSDFRDRFLAVGNGGMAGVIDFASMLSQLNSGLGFAVAGGDSGHLASNNNDGGGAPGIYLPYLHDQDQLEAWIHNGISLFTPAARALVNGYYAKPPKYSYYAGCSTGGAQGYALAQFHPELFDGIYAGCPGNWYSHLALSFLWNAQQTDTKEKNLTQAQLTFIRDSVVDACDEVDGVKDGLIENPLACKFDVETLLCTTGQTSSTNGTVTCLTSDQLDAVKAIYAGPKRSDTGAEVYPGFSFGSESEWIQQEGELANAFSIPILQNLVFDDLTYNASTFNWASDVDTLDKNAGTFIDEIDPDLSAFNGKFLTHQGWTDPFNAATWPIQHRKQVEAATKGDIGEWYRLFMVPGGGHCGPAATYPGVPSNYHFVEALVSWVENGSAPTQVLSTSVDGGKKTRKLCPWSETAKYCGGNVDDWESYECSL